MAESGRLIVEPETAGMIARCLIFVGSLMKRFSWRDGLLLSAPIGIIGAAFWFLTPPKPQILECSLRPATPLEISQGADFALLARASAPDKPFPCAGLDTTLFQSSAPHRPLRSLWYGARSTTHSGKFRPIIYEWQTRKAFKRADIYATANSLVGEVDFHSSCDVFPDLRKRFPLSTANLPVLEPEEVRRANFYVSEIQLRGWARKAYQLEIKLADVEDFSQGGLNKPRCVENWSWQDGQKKYAIPAMIGMWSSDKGKIVTVFIDLNVAGIPIPLCKGTKISGQLSVHSGWPQIITIEVTETPSPPWNSTDKLKITSQLAPLKVL